MRLKDQMPEFDRSGKWLNSKRLSHNDVIGNKPVLIYFWSVSCETCKKSTPKVNKLYDTYDDQLAVITVHMPRSERDKDLSEVRSAAQVHNIFHPIFVDNEHTLTNQFNNRYVPGYYLFDTNGKLRHRHSGSGGLQMLQKRINRIVNQSE
ncbi:redoxin domain-containing protein [Lentibacillus jeotgali]|uniref:redoxin domain-containing protein n=1 Tax=Lentibacillus jeotgali TaxID=558169 RepID=UPI0002626441|nr:redoxin domain-containing protein [Lentibacillus jeotgali]